MLGELVNAPDRKLPPMVNRINNGYVWMKGALMHDSIYVVCGLM